MMLLLYKELPKEEDLDTYTAVHIWSKMPMTERNINLPPISSIPADGEKVLIKPKKDILEARSRRQKRFKVQMHPDLANITSRELNDRRVVRELEHDSEDDDDEDVAPTETDESLADSDWDIRSDYGLHMPYLTPQI